MDIKDEGACRYCLKTFAGRSIGRHLTACKVKKARDAEEAQKKKPRPIYHLKLWSYKPYWLHVEMLATQPLADLDQFLRNIWLECCGHLSEFTIGNQGYSIDSETDDGWGMPRKSMNIPLKNVLSVKDQFRYEYDFGSTTEVIGQVYAQREGNLTENVRILARNTAPVFQCSGCSAQASWICAECEAFYCDACLEDHECGDEMALPVVNSPRMGVCGYYGDQDTDTFEDDQKNSKTS